MQSAGGVVRTLAVAAGLLLAGCAPRAPERAPAPGAEPPVAALVTREEEGVGADGVFHLTRYQERLVRAEGRVWTRRVLDARVTSAGAHEDRRHFHDWEVVPHVVRREPSGALGLELLLEDARVEVPPGEFDSVGFTPDWSEAASLVPARWVGAMRPLEGRAAPRGARWLEHREAGVYVRVLWSDALALALEVESGRDDGSRARRLKLQLEPLPSPLPWAGTERLVTRDISDYRD